MELMGLYGDGLIGLDELGLMGLDGDGLIGLDDVGLMGFDDTELRDGIELSGFDNTGPRVTWIDLTWFTGADELA